MVEAFQRLDALMRDAHCLSGFTHISFTGAALLFAAVAFHATSNSPRSVPLELDLCRWCTRGRFQLGFSITNREIRCVDELLCNVERCLGSCQVRKCAIVLTTTQVQGGLSSKAKWAHEIGVSR
jgi:hypothetical protein